MAFSPKQPSSPVPQVAGVKRRAVSLLPAFDPLSSSPGLPRPLKRSRDALRDSKDYPTPVPTSSTAILSSSPPRISRPLLPRSSIERAPLSDVRSIDLSEDGTPVLMGRSSVSCDFQLSANRLISRVHVKAFYKAAVSSLSKDRVEIHCEGWNGAKVHCLGKAHSLHKGEVFISEDRHADIMVDVHEARVMVRWPVKKLRSLSADSTSGWGDENSPRRSISPSRRASIASSPLRQRQRIASPVSPSPAVQAALAPSSPLLAHPPSSPPPVVIFEDDESDEQELPSLKTATTQESTQILSQPFRQPDFRPQSLREPEEKEAQSFESSSTNPPDDFSDHDEENDPVVHSFGPFGANLIGSMESFKTSDSPRVAAPRPRTPSPHPEQLAQSEETNRPDLSHIRSHIVNQLAYSRLNSLPLSTIISHLPNGDTYKPGDVRYLIINTACIGEIQREGKDAAGKPLESEYYYIPEADDDDMRKEAVVNNLGRTGLRNCRKQHKQYYWKKPKAR